MIPQETVARILDSADIVDVISDFVSLKRRGANYAACCPFHNEKTPSFYVFPSSGRYKCFGCGKGGSAIGFVMEHESMTYPEALRYLAKKYGIEIVEKEESAEQIAQRNHNESLYIVSDFAHKFFVQSLSSKEGRDIGYQYFRSRGLEDETIQKYGLGWAPRDRGAFPAAALSQGYKKEFLIETGLCAEYDGKLVCRFYDRVVFPFRSVSGRIVGFGARTLRSDYSKIGIGKYVNSSDSEIYHKKETLYGIWFAKSEISRKDRCYMVEGYLDVLSMHQLGITNVVASSGTSLTLQQIHMVRKFTRNMTIMYDGDSAGIHAAIRGLGMVLKEGMTVRIVLLPDGDDPDSFARAHTLAEVQDYISSNEKDFISFKTDLLLGEVGDDPIRRADLINDIADTIALIPDAIQRSVYVQSTAATFEMDQQVLFSRIQQTREKMAEDDRKAAERQKRSSLNQSSQGSGAPQESPYDAPPPPSYEDIPFDDYNPMAGDPIYVEGEPIQETPAETIPSQGQDTSHRTVFENPFVAPFERDLLSFILNDGCSRMCFESDSDFYDFSRQSTVAEFIDGALEGDPFLNSLYRRTYDEYFKMYNVFDIDMVGEEDAARHQVEMIKTLMDSPDREMADMVAGMTMEKYSLTVENFRRSMTSNSTRLVQEVPKAILAYHKTMIRQMNRDFIEQMKNVSYEEQKAFLAKIDRLNRKRKQILERIGWVN